MWKRHPAAFPMVSKQLEATFELSIVSRFGGDQIFTDWIVCSYGHTWREHPAPLFFQLGLGAGSSRHFYVKHLKPF